MADIFISYKKEDAGRVIRIVEALRAEGFTVWWDHGITPGAQWDQTIHNELAAAKAVIAIWSKDSVGAPWVKEEASVGKNRGILLPIRIDDVEPPLGFSLIQMGDLVGWSGDSKDPHWQLVLGALRAIVSGERPQGLEAAPRRRQGGAGVLIALALAVLIAGGVGYWLLTRAPAPEIEARGGASTSSPQTAPQQQAAAAAPNATEQAAWERALQTRTRQDLQSYLIAYPTGAYSNRARDMLLTCRTELRDVWTEQRIGQVLRGVNADLAPSEAAACAAARAFVDATAERTCRAFETNRPEHARNARHTLGEAPCDCRQTPGGWFCTTDPSFNCTYEERRPEQGEICG